MFIPLIAENESIAKISTIEKDVRYLPFDDENWFQAKVESDIFIGDAVYSGKQSTTTVDMNVGGQIVIGEDSLVIFDSVDGVTVPDVARGNIRLKISGEMRLSISGNRTYFSAGSGSEVLISLDEGGAGKIKVLSGAPKVKMGGSVERRLYAGQDLNLEKLISSRRVKSIRPPVVENVVVKPSAEPAKSDDLSDAIDDLAASEATVEPAPTPPPVVPPIPSEQLTQIVHTLTVEDLYEKVDSVRLRPKKKLLNVNQAGLLRWKNGAPLTATEKDRIQIFKLKSDFGAKVGSNEAPWLDVKASGGELQVDNWKLGKSAWRVANGENGWSQFAFVDVQARLSESREPVVEFEKKRVRLPNAEVALRLRDSSGRKMSGWIIEGSRTKEFKKSVIVYAESPNLILPLSKRGPYFFRIRSVDSQREVSRASAVERIDVLPPEKKVEPLPIRIAEKEKKEEKKEEPQERTVANTESESKVSAKREKVVKDEPEFIKGPWSVSVLAALNSKVSGVQIDNEVALPLSDLLGLAVSYDNGVSETQASLSTRVGVVGNSTDPDFSRFDLRYSRFWKPGISLLGIKPKLAAVVAYELYKNSAANSSFASGYQLAKFGTTLGFEIGRRFHTGGSVLLGSWNDGNRGAEIDGYLSYDIHSRFNFGIGYRIGLFEAGSATIAPGGELPYREAAAEAYSRLSISF